MPGGLAGRSELSGSPRGLGPAYQPEQLWVRAGVRGHVLLTLPARFGAEMSSGDESLQAGQSPALWGGGEHTPGAQSLALENPGSPSRLYTDF